MQEYTMVDLEQAIAERERSLQAMADYDGGNPNKHRGWVSASSRRVREIEGALKASGLLPMTEHEKLEAELDWLFPGAGSREVVEHKGRLYQRRFFPLDSSRSGKTITEWGKCWQPVDEMSAEERLQIVLGSRFPQANAGEVVEFEGRLFCRRLYRWKRGRTSLYWKPVDSLPERERNACLLDRQFPNATAGDVVELQGKRFRRQLYRRGQGGNDSLCWRAVK